MLFQFSVWQEMLHAMSEVVFSSKFYTQVLYMLKFPPLMTNMLCCVAREFDENILQKINDIFYEDEVASLPHPPDVSNYLMSEVFDKIYVIHRTMLMFSYL